MKLADWPRTSDYFSIITYSISVRWWPTRFVEVSEEKINILKENVVLKNTNMRQNINDKRELVFHRLCLHSARMSKRITFYSKTENILRNRFKYCAIPHNFPHNRCFFPHNLRPKSHTIFLFYPKPVRSPAYNTDRSEAAIVLGFYGMMNH